MCFLKKKNKEQDKNIFSIPCDYDGYDIVFCSGVTDLSLYAEINDIITEKSFDINSIDLYKKLSKDSTIEEFYEFYDEWIDKYLIESDYIIQLDKYLSIGEFVEGIIKVLKKKNYKVELDSRAIIDEYNNKLRYYNQPEDLNFDVLEANIVAEKLREKGYELICLFDGFENSDITVIPINAIGLLKEIEKKIKQWHYFISIKISVVHSIVVYDLAETSYYSKY